MFAPSWRPTKAPRAIFSAVFTIDHLRNASHIKNVYMQTRTESNNLYDPASRTFIEIGSHLCR